MREGVVLGLARSVATERSAQCVLAEGRLAVPALRYCDAGGGHAWSMYVRMYAYVCVYVCVCVCVCASHREGSNRHLQ